MNMKMKIGVWTGKGGEWKWEVCSIYNKREYIWKIVFYIKQNIVFQKIGVRYDVWKKML